MLFDRKIANKDPRLKDIIVLDVSLTKITDDNNSSANDRYFNKNTWQVTAFQK